MATTARTMILSGLRKLGEKEANSALSTAEEVNYLSDLNSMIESWSLDRLMVYQLLQESHPLTTGVQSYTIGSGGDWNTARPNRIVDPCFCRNASNQDLPVIIVDAQTFGRIVLKPTQGPNPSKLFYDQAFSGGLGAINLYPLPGAGLTLYINSWKQLQRFATLDDAIALPPGYQRAIEFNFPIEVAGGFRPVPAEVIRVAQESKAAIKKENSATDGGVLRMENVARRPNILLGF